MNWVVTLLLSTPSSTQVGMRMGQIYMLFKSWECFLVYVILKTSSSYQTTTLWWSISYIYTNNISIIPISLCFAQHGCKADIVVKFWQPLCGDRKHHPLIVDSFGPYGEGGGGLIAGWGQLIWRKCPPPTPPAHRPCQCVPNLFYNPTTLAASFLALSQKSRWQMSKTKSLWLLRGWDITLILLALSFKVLIHCNHKRSENCLKWSNFLSDPSPIIGNACH